MKITKAQIYLMDVQGRHPVLVRLLTDEGIAGVGDAAIAYGLGATAAAGMIKDLVEGIVLGQDPFRIDALWHEMYDHSFWAKGGGPIVFAGMAAIEQALWDIKGKALRVPVYEMLGGAFRDKVWVYANGWSFRCFTPDEFARAAEKVVADGYTALKLYPLAMPETADGHGRLRHVSLRHIDREHEDLAVARVKAVREAVGPDVEVLVDVSAELTTDAVIRLGRRLEEFDLFFLEEPVDPFDFEAMKKVSERVDIPIAAGERLYTRYGFRRLLEMHAVDIVQPDIGNTGGILETRFIAAMAEAYNMKVQPHNTSVTPVSTAAALQLSACIPNLSILEIYPYRPAEHYAFVDRAPELEREGSHLPVPQRPGLGVELLLERVAAFLWAECAL
ncbi:MAG: mandelate racemase/muconate lactonizing enzyme family protein [Caldilineae bacterium]|nr:MAG: mandelate racemase/muconate lactonizing enzyme family protein [Caldilineae bacterium]